jgi:hypothetical protein
VHAALPWVISLIAHTMLFLGLALAVWVVESDTPEALTVIGARVDDGPGDTYGDPQGGGQQLDMPDEFMPAGAGLTAEAPVDLLGGFESPSASGMSIIGIGAGSADGLVGIGSGSGEGEQAGFGFGVGAYGEGPSFFGLGRGATGVRRICYVVDRSGSMVEELDYVKDEVIRSVNRLHRTQQYHVILFSSKEPTEAPPGEFVYAVEEYKKRTFAFLQDVEAAGSTDPVPAMARAFHLQADLIYFLTDGEFAPELIEKLRIWNAEKKVRIYTIAFLRRQGEELLKTVARENGGDYTFVSESDLH